MYLCLNLGFVVGLGTSFSGLCNASFVFCVFVLFSDDLRCFVDFVALGFGVTCARGFVVVIWVVRLVGLGCV